MWLLMTGELPNDQQFNALSDEIKQRSHVPKETEDFMANLPKSMHPMTQLSMGLLHLQSHSKFAAAYRSGVHKSKYWEVIYDDCMDLIAKIPRLAALIYRHLYKANIFII